MVKNKVKTTKFIIYFLSLLLCVCIGGFFVSVNINGSKTAKANTTNFYFANYDSISSISNASSYLGDLSNSYVDNGVIISPYYNLTINGTAVPVYGTRTANGVHSFVYLDVENASTQSFNLDLEITGSSMSTVFINGVTVEVLPQKHNVTASVNRRNKKVTASINKLGSYSFVFNSSYVEPLTIMVTEKEDTSTLFGSKAIQYIDAGDYSTRSTYSQTIFTAENTVYYFRAGRYKINEIQIPSNSVAYFEMGAYLEVKASPLGSLNSFFFVEGKNNVTVAGRPLFDMSPCQGAIEGNGSVRDKTGFCIQGCTNVLVQGVTVINSQTWTLCFTDCNDLTIKNVMLFGYRTFADGVMIANTINGVCEDSFIRTGDDAFETKSTSLNNQATSNITFRNCDAWTDKAVAYGCIYESTYDQSNITFEDCSVGFALGVWSPHLGNCVIQLGQQDRPHATYDVKFKNIEVYHNNNQAVINCYIGGSGGEGDGAGTIRDIYFQDITCKTNNGSYMVNLQTYDNQDCTIGDLYIDNLVVEGTQLTSSNRKSNVNDAVVGGYDFNKLHINTLPTAYNLTITASNATVTGVTEGEYDIDETVTVTVTADTGYYIDAITWGGVNIDVTDKNETTFSQVMSRDIDLVVIAERIPNYNLTVSNGGATIEGATAGSYEENTQFNVVVTAPQGYIIKSISWGTQKITVTDQESTSFTASLTKNTTLSVVCEEKPKAIFAVTVQSENASVIGINTSNYQEGTVLNVTVKANVGYYINRITLNGGDIDFVNSNSVSFTVTVDKETVMVVDALRIPIYEVTVSSLNATVTGVTNGSQYYGGDEITITVTADNGYKITSIKWGEQQITLQNDNSVNFTVTLLEDTLLDIKTIQTDLGQDGSGSSQIPPSEPTSPSDPPNSEETTLPGAVVVPGEKIGFGTCISVSNTSLILGLIMILSSLICIFIKGKNNR